MMCTQEERPHRSIRKRVLSAKQMGLLVLRHGYRLVVSKQASNLSQVPLSSNATPKLQTLIPKSNMHVHTHFHLGWFSCVKGVNRLAVFCKASQWSRTIDGHRKGSLFTVMIDWGAGGIKKLGTLQMVGFR